MSGEARKIDPKRDVILLAEAKSVGQGFGGSGGGGIKITAPPAKTPASLGPDLRHMDAQPTPTGANEHPGVRAKPTNLAGEQQTQGGGGGSAGNGHGAGSGASARESGGAAHFTPTRLHVTTDHLNALRGHSGGAGFVKTASLQLGRPSVVVPQLPDTPSQKIAMAFAALSSIEEQHRRIAEALDLKSVRAAIDDFRQPNGSIVYTPENVRAYSESMNGVMANLGELDKTHSNVKIEQIRTLLNQTSARLNINTTAVVPIDVFALPSDSIPRLAVTEVSDVTTPTVSGISVSDRSR